MLSDIRLKRLTISAGCFVSHDSMPDAYTGRAYYSLQPNGIKSPVIITGFYKIQGCGMFAASIGKGHNDFMGCSVLIQA
jgi:hypothetical protein